MLKNASFLVQTYSRLALMWCTINLSRESDYNPTLTAKIYIQPQLVDRYLKYSIY